MGRTREAAGTGTSLPACLPCLSAMALHVPALWAVPSNRTSCRTLTCTVYSVPWMHSSVREVVLRWCGQPGLHYMARSLDWELRNKRQGIPRCFAPCAQPPSALLMARYWDRRHGCTCSRQGTAAEIPRGLYNHTTGEHPTQYWPANTRRSHFRFSNSGVYDLFPPSRPRDGPN